VTSENTKNGINPISHKSLVSEKNKGDHSSSGKVLKLSVQHSPRFLNYSAHLIPKT